MIIIIMITFSFKRADPDSGAVDDVRILAFGHFTCAFELRGYKDMIRVRCVCVNVQTLIWIFGCRT